MIAPDLYDQPDVETVYMWNLIKTAKYMGVNPWELAERPEFWRCWGETCMRADEAINAEQARRLRKKSPI